MPNLDLATHSFRLACAHLWLRAGVVHLLFLGGLVLAVNLAGLTVDNLWLVVMCLVPFMFWIVYGVQFRLNVTPNGLGWRNIDGVRCFLAWADIEKAERKKLLGESLLMVWSKTDGGPFYMPLFLAESDLLHECVEASAGGEHPVTIAIAGR